MPVDLATLVIKVDAVGAATATGQLDATAVAAGRAEMAANRLAISQNRLLVSQNAVATSAARTQVAISSAEAAMTRAATATLAYDAAMARAAAATARLAAAQATVSTSAMGAVAGMARVGTAVNGMAASALGAVAGISRMGTVAAGVAVGSGATAAGVNRVRDAFTGTATSSLNAVAGMSRVIPAAAAVVEGTARVATAATATSAAAARMGVTFRDVTRDMSAGLVTVNQGISGLPYALSRVTGPLMLIGIVGAAAIGGIVFAIKKAIDAVDDYQVSLISIAAGLTNVAKAGQGDFGKMFEQNKEFAVGMYRTITLEAVKHFATAQEMMTSYNKLVQFGYAVRKDEVGALGTLTDLIKIKTKGQDVDRQLNTEIMALMQGQARAGALLAQELQSRLGPGWKDLVAQHRAAGDLLVWMASLFPGIDAANKDILNTIDSQWATTKSLVGLIGVGGLQGLYKSIVDLLKDINAYLLEHEGIIADKLIASWITVKNYVTDIKEGIDGISFDNLLPITSTGFSALSVFSALITVIEYAIWGIQKLNQAVQWVIDLLKQMTSTTWDIIVDLAGLKAAWDWVMKIYNVVSKSITWHITTLFSSSGSPEKLTRPDMTTPGVNQREISQAQLSRKGGTMMYHPGIDYPIEMYGSAPTQTKAKLPPPIPPKGGKGGGGGSDGTDRMQSIMDTLTKEFTKMSEGSLAEVDAWEQKMINDINKVAAKGAEGANAIALAHKVAGAKKEKIEDEFTLYVAKETGDRYAAIDEKYNQDMIKYKGAADYKENLEAIKTKKRADADYKFYNDLESMQKDSLSKYAAALPLLSQQLPIQKQLLDIDIERAKRAMEKKIEDDRIPEHLANQLRQLHAVAAQEQRMAEDRKKWMTQGIGGGLKAGAVERGNEASTRTAQWTIDAMKGAEAWLGETGGQAFVDALHGKKADLKKLFEDMGDSLIKQLFKMATTKLFDNVWSGIGKAFGLDLKGKPDGSEGNPFHVTFTGMGGIIPKATHAAVSDDGFSRTERAMQKTGMSVGGGRAGGMDSVAGIKALEREYTKYFNMRMKDEKVLDKLDDKIFKEEKKENQFVSKDWMRLQQEKIQASSEFYNSEQVGQQTYQDSFGTMLSGVSNLWLMGQAAMTAAGVQGDTARITSMIGFGLKAISIIWGIVKGETLALAWKSGAAAYASVMTALPYPANMITAPIMAAIAFAATLMGGGGGGGGKAGGGGEAMTGSAGGDYQVGMTGPRYVHQNETILPAWAAQSWRNIVSRESSGDSGGSSTPVVYSPTYHINAIDARGVDVILEKHGKTMTKVINREVGRRGRRV